MSDVDRPISHYLRVVAFTHPVVAQTLHQRLSFQQGMYEKHHHEIRDDDSVDEKNRAAEHIDEYHRGGDDD